LKELDGPAGRGAVMRNVGEGGLGAVVSRVLTPWTTALVVLFVAAALAQGSGANAGLPAGIDGPIALLGSSFDARECTTAPQAVGRGIEVCCPTFSAVTVDGTVRVVSLFAPAASSVVGAYEEALPEGLAWHDRLEDVIARLGTPSRITDMYGPPTLVYTYRGDPYHSLELQFDANDELVRINASLTR
jgi:hypothetical protein